MVDITLTQREYVALVAGQEVSEDEILEFIRDYEDWQKTKGEYHDQPQDSQA